VWLAPIAVPGTALKSSNELVRETTASLMSFLPNPHLSSPLE
jgi:hypothetical protein